ncbi:MAG: ergothioneine biosynthesis protein EgtB [Planctomycetota bacterium]
MNPVNAERYASIRQFTETLAEPLSDEDCSIQSMPDASPVRWHLAHTTWFFETFLLGSIPGYCSSHPEFEQLFNSYYNTVGQPFPRSQRGCLSRPGMREVEDYRKRIDECVLRTLDRSELDASQESVLETGLQHEQQHQELILTDIKHAFSCNPLLPTYRDSSNDLRCEERQLSWITGAEGLVTIGHDEPDFSFDNETPQHRVHLHPHQIASRCVTNGEYLRFIEDGGYRRPELWLSMGWDAVQQNRWTCPLYWHRRSNEWQTFTLGGVTPVDPSNPVCHVSYFEADAYARWSGHRLPTEFEWEAIATQQAADPDEACWSDQLVSTGRLIHPQTRQSNDTESALSDAFGNTWEWTSSQYSAFPGYVPLAGALGEYNGKFMCNQFVLRGGSCATPSGHIRPTYRNFFPPETRWQFTGIRLAQSSAPADEEGR